MLGMVGHHFEVTGEEGSLYLSCPSYGVGLLSSRPAHSHIHRSSTLVVDGPHGCLFFGSGNAVVGDLSVVEFHHN